MQRLPWTCAGTGLELFGLGIWLVAWPLVLSTLPGATETWTSFGGGIVIIVGSIASVVAVRAPRVKTVETASGELGSGRVQENRVASM